MTNDPIGRSLLAFFFPLFAGSFFQMLYNTVDALIVGRFVGTLALSAVGGAAAVIVNIFVGFFLGISSGGSVIASQAFGGGNNRELKDAVHTSIALAILGGAILTVFLIVFAVPMLRILRTPEDSMADSIMYLRVLAAGMIPAMIYNMGAGILRAVGDSRRPFYYLVAACVSNIILDYISVAMLGMGVGGAAGATAISQGVAAILVLIELMRADGAHRLYAREIRPKTYMFRKIMRIGVPAAIQSMMYSLSNALIQAYVNAFGSVVVAAWAVTGKIDAFFWMILNSMGTTVMTFSGQNYGAGKMKRVYGGMRTSLLFCAGFSILFGIVLYTFAPYLVPLFSKDAAVIAEGIILERYFARIYLLFVCIEILSGVLRGMGDALVPTLITVLGVCGIRILWIVALPKGHSVIDVSRSYPVSWAIASVAFIVYFIYRYRKMRKEEVTIS